MGKHRITPSSRVLHRVTSSPDRGGPSITPVPGQRCLPLAHYKSTRRKDGILNSVLASKAGGMAMRAIWCFSFLLLSCSDVLKQRLCAKENTIKSAGTS